jgi:hypothetical protein
VSATVNEIVQATVAPVELAGATQLGEVAVELGEKVPSLGSVAGQSADHWRVSA